MTVWRWRDPRVAGADIWVDAALAGDAAYVSDLIAVAAREASSLGASALDVVVPEGLSSALQSRVAATVVPLERGDPWLVKRLGLRVDGS